MNEKFVETKNTMPTSCVLSAYYTDASMKLSRNFGCVPPSLFTQGMCVSTGVCM